MKAIFIFLIVAIIVAGLTIPTFILKHKSGETFRIVTTVTTKITNFSNNRNYSWYRKLVNKPDLELDGVFTFVRYKEYATYKYKIFYYSKNVDSIIHVGEGSSLYF